MVLALLLVECCLAFVSAGTAWFDVRAIYTYERLKKEADVILIGMPVSSEATKKKLDPGYYGGILAEQRTTFRALVVLKGKCPKNRVTVYHYVIGPPPKKKGDGPTPCLFDPDVFRFTDKAGKPLPATYLIFLRKRKGGNYEPVSGMDQMSPSFQRLERPLEVFDSRK
jgi:hypothetical protein